MTEQLEQEVRAYLVNAALDHTNPDEIARHVLNTWGPAGGAITQQLAAEFKNTAPKLNRRQRRNKSWR
jgi:hypothetical protein